MTKLYRDLTAEEMRAEYAAVKTKFDALKAKRLKLNMARGKPSKAQLDMVSDMLSILTDPKGLRIRWHRRPQLWGAFRPVRSQAAICGHTGL